MLKKINFLQLLFDLIIVFIGVYTAFTLTNNQQENEQVKEGKKVITLLKEGGERYEKTFGGIAAYHQKFNVEYQAKLDNGEIPNFGDTYYAAPQYPIGVIDYLLTKESYSVFTIEFYLQLTTFANSIQRLMYVEEKLVQIGERYEPLPAEGSPSYQRAKEMQRYWAQKYLEYLNRRGKICADLETQAKNLGQTLNSL